MPIILRLLLVTAVAVLIDGCKTAETSEPFTPFEPRLRQTQVTQQTDVESSPVEYKTLVERGPEVRVEGQVVDLLSGKLGDNLEGDELVVSFNNMPIPGFINEVFGEQLGLSFTIDPAVQKLNDLVTLRVIEPVSPSNLFQIAQRTLAAYGIGIDLQQNLYVFSPDKNVSTSDSPLVVTGMALPEVPQSHRPYFVFVSLKVISNNRIINWLNQALKGTEISITTIPEGNSLLIQGRYDAVNQALAMIEALDQPLLRGKNSRLVEPAFSSVDQLSKDLVEVLKSEGYDASLRPPLGSIIILPLSSSNQIIIFAAEDSVVDHVVDWAKKLDRQHALDIENDRTTITQCHCGGNYSIEDRWRINGTRTGLLGLTQFLGQFDINISGGMHDRLNREQDAGSSVLHCLDNRRTRTVSGLACAGNQWDLIANIDTGYLATLDQQPRARPYFGSLVFIKGIQHGPGFPRAVERG